MTGGRTPLFVGNRVPIDKCKCLPRPQRDHLHLHSLAASCTSYIIAKLSASTLILSFYNTEINLLIYSVRAHTPEPVVS